MLTIEVYTNTVLTSFPELKYLDNTQILDDDRNFPEICLEIENAALTFTCHRIIGLPAPPKQKGIVQTIHLEITLPLLEEIKLEPEIEEEPSEPELPGKKSKKGKADKKAKSAKGKKGKDVEPSPYEAEDEYLTERIKKIKDLSFKTQRMPWAKVMQFPENAIIVESPDKNLTAVRDTFRSTVNVKVVYLQVQPPVKGKGKGKEAGKKKGDKKGGQKGASDSKVVKEPTETILKKVTLANFYCDLHSVNWSEKTIDFYWAAHPQSNPKAIPVEGSLRAVQYVEGKGKKAAKTSKSTEKKTGTESEFKIEATSENIMPKIFTCQVGFGLKRI